MEEGSGENESSEQARLVSGSSSLRFFWRCEDSGSFWVHQSQIKLRQVRYGRADSLSCHFSNHSSHFSKAWEAPPTFFPTWFRGEELKNEFAPLGNNEERACKNQSAHLYLPGMTDRVYQKRKIMRIRESIEHQTIKRMNLNLRGFGRFRIQANNPNRPREEKQEKGRSSSSKEVGSQESAIQPSAWPAQPVRERTVLVPCFVPCFRSFTLSSLAQGTQQAHCVGLFVACPLLLFW